MAMYIKIPIKGFNEYADWRPAIKLAEEEHQYLIGQFAHYMAKKMAEEVQKAINTQRFVSKWPPLSVKYLHYKKMHHMSLNIWEATGFLKNNITAYRSNNAYIVGVSKRVRYPPKSRKNKTEPGVLAWKVMFWMEFGTRKMPARPLFRPVASQMQKNIRRYWIQFLDSKGIDNTKYK